MGKKPLESSTGYAWLPLLGTDGNINTGLFQLPIAPEIQPGYLQLRSSMVCSRIWWCMLSCGISVYSIHLDQFFLCM
ncbi:hypothetical protein AHF37_02881 [Paragonimus kellicotti]|nr:hypothetical protein AHF37_02881 [Paragonimus kellicotti]